MLAGMRVSREECEKPGKFVVYIPQSLGDRMSDWSNDWSNDWLLTRFIDWLLKHAEMNECMQFREEAGIPAKIVVWFPRGLH